MAGAKALRQQCVGVCEKEPQRHEGGGEDEARGAGRGQITQGLKVRVLAFPPSVREVMGSKLYH